MALTNETQFFLISSLILTIFAVGYAFIMIYTFIRKKTLGTAFLMLAFSLLGLGETSNTIAFWLEAYEASSAVISGVLQTVFVNLYALSILFFYFFSTRHILRDNDFTKSLMGVFFGEIIAIVTATMVAVLLIGQDLIVKTSQTFRIPNTNLDYYAPTVILSLVLFVPLIILVLFRISYNLIVIRRKITESVPRAGITYIGLSVSSLLGSTIVLILFYIPGIYVISGLLIFLQTFRLLTTIMRLIFGYLGWTLPDWLKKRIRGKAWIVKTLKEMDGKPVTYSYSSSREIKADTHQIKEISEP
ncbi:MAG: hypothetical protein ACTSXA_12400 [Candidatus Heimdallarchaeota archaeon]